MLASSSIACKHSAPNAARALPTGPHPGICQRFSITRTIKLAASAQPTSHSRPEAMNDNVRYEFTVNGISVQASYMIGDRWRDIDAATAAGCTAIMIDFGYSEHVFAEPAVRVKSILKAAEWILSREVG